MNVDELAPGTPAIIDASILGYPRTSLSDIPLPAAYAVQAIIQPYEQYHRGDGHAVWLPRTVINKFGGLLAGPGTLYSAPVNITLRADAPLIHLSVSLIQPDVPLLGPANDTAYIKHVRIFNNRLSKFWGRDIYLEACILLPWGWAEHPNARYPMVVFQVYFSNFE